MEKKDKFRIFARAMFLQTGWNFERLQNVGLCFAVLPYLKKLWKDGESFNKALLRHLQVFNTQPFMATFVIGNICKMEENIFFEKDKNKRDELTLFLANIKKALASGFASVGDRIFWARIFPLTTFLCVIIWLYGGFYGWFANIPGETNMLVLFAGPAAAVLLNALISVYFRWKGLQYGYDCGGSASCGLDLMNWTKHAKSLSFLGFWISLFTFFVLFALAAVYYSRNYGLPNAFFKSVLTISAVFICVLMTRKKRTFFSTALAIFGFSFIGVLILKIAGLKVLW